MFPLNRLQKLDVQSLFNLHGLPFTATVEKVSCIVLEVLFVFRHIACVDFLLIRFIVVSLIKARLYLFLFVHLRIVECLQA